MSVLITGGSGFIGMHASRAFLEHGHDVVATQFRVRRELPMVEEQHGRRFMREILDVTSGYALNDVMERHSIDYILHLAVPGLGSLSPAEDYRITTSTLLNVLDAARRYAVKRVVVASSILVYWGLAGPFVESMPVPISSNIATCAYKKAEEITGMHFAERAGLDVVFARIAYVYGPLYHSLSNAPSRIAHAVVRGTQVEGPPPSAEDRYDYLYVVDCAEALVALQTAPRLAERIYNIGGGAAIRNADILEAVRRTEPGAVFAFGDSRDPFHESDSYLDIDRLARDTGFRPSYDIVRGMETYISWLRERAV
jgi:UDP-glucose 4-epimerase